jgi:hypothetical protein
MRGSRPHDFAEKVPRKALHRPQLERDGGFVASTMVEATIVKFVKCDGGRKRRGGKKK